jgi:hypothetical protein
LPFGAVLEQVSESLNRPEMRVQAGTNRDGQKTPEIASE